MNRDGLLNSTDRLFPNVQFTFTLNISIAGLPVPGASSKLQDELINDPRIDGLLVQSPGVLPSKETWITFFYVGNGSDTVVRMATDLVDQIQQLNWGVTAEFVRAQAGAFGDVPPAPGVFSDASIGGVYTGIDVIENHPNFSLTAIGIGLAVIIFLAMGGSQIIAAEIISRKG